MTTAVAPAPTQTVRAENLRFGDTIVSELAGQRIAWHVQSVRVVGKVVVAKLLSGTEQAYRRDRAITIEAR
jgi:hypothetical protein